MKGYTFKDTDTSHQTIPHSIYIQLVSKVQMEEQEMNIKLKKIIFKQMRIVLLNLKLFFKAIAKNAVPAQQWSSLMGQ